MGLILAPDDIAANAFVAIHSVVPACRPRLGKPRLVPIAPSLMPVPPGLPLRVLEVSLPFVACAMIEPDGSESGPVIIDLRHIRLCRLNGQFVSAITSFASTQCSTEQEFEQEDATASAD